MIKLIKITRRYIKWAYTTNKQNLIFGIPLLQEWWIWHCYSHPNYLCQTYTRPLFITQLWKLISQKLKMIETNRFRFWILISWPLYLIKEEIKLYKLHTCAKRCTEALFYLTPYYLKYGEDVLCFCKMLTFTHENVLVAKGKTKPWTEKPGKISTYDSFLL